MSRPKYHLNECNNCNHRYVCKYLDKIDKLLKKGDLPLDLTHASCNEYESKENTFEMEKVSADQLWPMLTPEDALESLNESLLGLLDSNNIPTKITMNNETMFLLKKATGQELHTDLTAVLLVTGDVVPITISSNLATGYYIIESEVDEDVD